MTGKLISAALLLAATVLVPLRADAGSLRGSSSSMETQHRIAVDEDLSFLDTPADVRDLVAHGGLESVQGNADFSLSGVSFPYARPEVHLLIERLAAQFHAETGLRLVVTSLTRPVDLQPKNAHALSVHPAGMAVDFRVPAAAKDRMWLEKALLNLEGEGVLDVTRERYPQHYHVAVYPLEYAAYASARDAAPPSTKTIVAPAVTAAPFVIASSAEQAGRSPLGAVVLTVIALSALVAMTPRMTRIAVTR